MLNIVGIRVNFGCYDNRYWKFKDLVVGLIFCKGDYFILKLYIIVIVLRKYVKIDIYVSYFFLLR